MDKAMIKTKKLSNGMRVVLENMPYLQSVSFGVWIGAGSVCETKENNGIAHVIEHMLFKGTKNRTAKQLADDMAHLGGNMNAYTSKECTCLYLTTLENNLEAAAAMIGDMLLNSLYDTKDLEKEKDVILEEINMYEDSPEDMVHEMLQKEVWANQSIGYIISGDAENVRRITREQIMEFINQYYVPSNIVLSLAGKYNETEAIAILENIFGRMKHRAQSYVSKEAVYHRAIYQFAKDIEQVHMNLAFPAISSLSEEQYVFAIVNSVFGGSDNSRLFQVLREQLALTYSIFSYESSYRCGGLFQIDAVLNPGNVVFALEKILELLEEFVRDGITSKELQAAKEQIKIDLIIESENTRNRMSSNGKRMLLLEKCEELEEVIKKLNQVTVEETNQLIRTYFDIRKSSISLVGNVEGLNQEKIKQRMQFD